MRLLHIALLLLATTAHAAPYQYFRIGLVHYNTPEEVDRLLAALREIVGT